MNFPFRESYCFLFSLFISAFSLNAQTTTQVVVQDFETWSQIGVSKKFNDEFKMQLNQGLRLNDNSSSVDQVLTNLSGIYQKTNAVSFGFGILFVDFMNQFQIGGFKLGFWFAQQGSIYVFVILIFVYIRLMNRLDKKFNLDK